jgi:hypothetical protein
MRRRSRRHALAALALIQAGCSVTAPRWWVDPQPTRQEIEILLETDRASLLSSDALLLHQIPDIPVRDHLRPCCAFGSELRASLGGVIPIPFYRVENILGPGDPGPHRYDSGVLSLARDGQVDPAFGRERNGLVFTCRGGFIDTAHVRDYADWSIFLASRIGRVAIEGGTLELPDEGGRRRVVVRPLPPAVVEAYGLRPVVANLAQWLAFQLSIWHEIATWYGWASVPGFPERASAFSPEDLYSNMVGTKLMLAVVYQSEARSEFAYNRAIDAWLASALDLLGAVPSSLGREVTAAVDGLWWDSSRRLPDPRLVPRRNFEIGSPVRPWLPPERVLPEKARRGIAEACGGDLAPIDFANPAVRRGVTLPDHVTLEIEVDDALAAQEPFASRGRRLSQADFPAIVAIVREQALAELGPRADRPD